MTDKQLLTSAVRIFGPKVLGHISQSEIRKALGLCDQKQMAAQLGLTYEAFRWRITKGDIPKPKIKLERRAYYTAAQAAALEKREAGASNAETPFHGGNS